MHKRAAGLEWSAKLHARIMPRGAACPPAGPRELPTQTTCMRVVAKDLAADRLQASSHPQPTATVGHSEPPSEKSV